MCFMINDENFRKEVLESTKPMIVEIGADWCGSCQIMAPIIRFLSDTYNGRIGVGRIDLDTNESLARTYGINELPFYLFYKEGEVVDHAVGAISKGEMLYKIESLLKSTVSKERRTK